MDTNAMPVPQLRGVHVRRLSFPAVKGRLWSRLVLQIKHSIPMLYAIDRFLEASFDVQERWMLDYGHRLGCRFEQKFKSVFNQLLKKNLIKKG